MTVFSGIPYNATVAGGGVDRAAHLEPLPGVHVNGDAVEFVFGDVDSDGYISHKSKGGDPPCL